MIEVKTYEKERKKEERQIERERENKENYLK